jgi:two-component system phosphate regulon response regulator PhoB
LKTVKIVIVDDDEDLLEELAELLTAEGCVVEPTSDSVAAASAIRQSQPDLVLLDVRMREKDGFEVAAELAAAPETATIPIIVMSGHYTIEERGVLEKIPGVREVLLKPFSYEDMMSRVYAVRRRQ